MDCCARGNRQVAHGSHRRDATAGNQHDTVADWCSAIAVDQRTAHERQVGRATGRLRGDGLYGHDGGEQDGKLADDLACVSMHHSSNGSGGLAP